MNTPYQRQRRMTQQRLALKPTIRVGDKVRLNDHGLQQTYGSTRGLSKMKQFTYTITGVDQESMTLPEPTFPVQVDDPELDKFMIDDRCFDIVERAKPPGWVVGPFDDMPEDSMFC